PRSPRSADSASIPSRQVVCRRAWRRSPGPACPRSRARRRRAQPQSVGPSCRADRGRRSTADVNWFSNLRLRGSPANAPTRATATLTPQVPDETSTQGRSARYRLGPGCFGEAHKSVESNSRPSASPLIVVQTKAEPAATDRVKGRGFERLRLDASSKVHFRSSPSFLLDAVLPAPFNHD